MNKINLNLLNSNKVYNYKSVKSLKKVVVFNGNDVIKDVKINNILSSNGISKELEVDLTNIDKFGIQKIEFTVVKDGNEEVIVKNIFVDDSSSIRSDNLKDHLKYGLVLEVPTGFEDDRKLNKIVYKESDSYTNGLTVDDKIEYEKYEGRQDGKAIIKLAKHSNEVFIDLSSLKIFVEVGNSRYLYRMFLKDVLTGEIIELQKVNLISFLPFEEKKFELLMTEEVVNVIIPKIEHPEGVFNITDQKFHNHIGSGQFRMMGYGNFYKFWNTNEINLTYNFLDKEDNVVESITVKPNQIEVIQDPDGKICKATITKKPVEIPKKKFKITYNANGGEGELPEEEEIEEGEEYTIKHNKLFLKDKVADGWIDEKGQKYDGGDKIIIEEDKIFTAEFRQIEFDWSDVEKNLYYVRDNMKNILKSEDGKDIHFESEYITFEDEKDIQNKIDKIVDKMVGIPTNEEYLEILMASSDLNTILNRMKKEGSMVYIAYGLSGDWQVNNEDNFTETAVIGDSYTVRAPSKEEVLLTFDKYGVIDNGDVKTFDIGEEIIIEKMDYNIVPFDIYKIFNTEDMDDLVLIKGFTKEERLDRLNELNYIEKDIKILNGAFDDSRFRGFFPKLNNLKHIGDSAFRESNFIGRFPQLNNLTYIGKYAFGYYRFDNIPSDFYPGWDGMNAWFKPVDVSAEEAINYDVDDNGHITINGLKDGFQGWVGPFSKVKELEINGRKIVKVSKNSFRNSEFTGDFPLLDNLEYVGDSAFRESNFTGGFPQLNNLTYIGEFAFWESNFTGGFPQLNNLENVGRNSFRNSEFSGSFPLLGNLMHIGYLALTNSSFNNIPNDFYPGWDGKNKWFKPVDVSAEEAINYDVDDNGHITINGLKDGFQGWVGPFSKIKELEIDGKKIVKISKNSFEDSKFTGEFYQLDDLEYIGYNAFYNSKFTGKFPQLGNLEYIGSGAFRESNFTGGFPLLDNLTYIGEIAFLRSSFNNIPNNFYPGWNGSSKWTKPEKLISRYLLSNDAIYTPGGRVEGVLSSDKELLDKRVQDILDSGQWPIHVIYEQHKIEDDKIINTKLMYEEIFLANDGDNITVNAKDIGLKVLNDKKQTVKVNGSKTITFIVE